MTTTQRPTIVTTIAALVLGFGLSGVGCVESSDDADLGIDEELALEHDDALEDDRVSPEEEILAWGAVSMEDDHLPCGAASGWSLDSESVPEEVPEGMEYQRVLFDGSLEEAETAIPVMDELASEDYPVNSACGGFVWRAHTFPKTSCWSCGYWKRTYGQFSGIAIEYLCPNSTSTCCYAWFNTPSYNEFCADC
ncbi:MAG: hypothetical protein AB1Z98_01610 [Nannocystaceae bacterium]